MMRLLYTYHFKISLAAEDHFEPISHSYILVQTLKFSDDFFWDRLNFLTVFKKKFQKPCATAILFSGGKKGKQFSNSRETLRCWTIPLLRFWFHSCDELNKRRENEPERFQKTATSERGAVCTLSETLRHVHGGIFNIDDRHDNGRYYYMKMTIIKEIRLILWWQKQQLWMWIWCWGLL